MVSIPSLWLPILVAAVLVFVVSSLVHMVLGWHRSDYSALPDEAATLETLGRQSLAPGLYPFPHCPDHKDMGKPEMQARFAKGPVGFVTVIPSGPPNMGVYLGTWFAFCLVVGVFVAYLAGRTLAPGAHYLAVFRVAGATAFMAYGLGQVVDSIWKGQRWSATFRHVVDGLAYALVTGGAFGWLWPR